MIEVRDLTKVYGDTVAVEDLTFTVRPGKVTGFLGPNGAGKSTTMRIIAGLHRPTRGEALVAGLPYPEHAQPARALGVLLDGTGAHPQRSGRHHLLSLAAALGVGRGRVAEVLDLVGLADVAHRRVAKFSLGMRQRLGLAAALLADPEVLVLDEPMNGLDAHGVRWVRELLRGLAEEGRTVFVSSHLLGEMAELADQLVVLGRGRLLADVSVEELIGDTGSLADAFLALTDPARRGGAA